MANSAVDRNCYIVLNMPSAFSFYISHFTWGIMSWLIIVEICYRFNELISNYIMFMFKTNEPIKVIHLQKLANQSMLDGPL